MKSAFYPHPYLMSTFVEKLTLHKLFSSYRVFCLLSVSINVACTYICKQTDILYSPSVLMGSCNKTATVTVVLSVLALVVAIIAVFWKELTNSPEEVDCGLTCARTDRLEEVKEQLANLTEKVKMEREDSNRTTSELVKEVQQLKQDYMELLNETKALNQSINYTTSATVQRALNELKDVKDIQSNIQKKLQALSHLNDTAKDYLNLVKSVADLTTEVNENITHLEENIEHNRDEWKRALDANPSGIKSNISTLKRRFDEFEDKFEKTQNKRNNTSGAALLSQSNVFYTLNLILLTALDGVIVHV